jgi:hypothetical protein
VIRTGGSATTEIDELDASARPSEVEAMLEILVMPPADGHAIPVAGNLPTKNVRPTDKLMIGWVRWAESLPWLDGPIKDQTGEHCADGQDGPVWYLAGTAGGPVVRQCDIPAGKQLFFPLINTWAPLYPEWFPSEEAIASILIFLEGYCTLVVERKSASLRPSSPRSSGDR